MSIKKRHPKPQDKHQPFVMRILTGAFLICFSWATAGAASDFRLANAAMDGNLEKVRSLLRQNVDLNAAQNDGMTALHWAVYKADINIAQILILAGADLQVGTRIGSMTPLSFAARNGDNSMIELLLKAGADTELRTGLGTTPLMQASASGEIEAVQTLLNYGSEVNAKETTRQQTAVMFRGRLK